ncbi:MAG: CHAT domain-containing protein [Deltaproteobacteria bacterium]|nr:CHAT domain-containing protein [Deltaproteobacteria bacterium]
MKLLTMRISLDREGHLSYVLLSMDPSERINQPNFIKSLDRPFAEIAKYSRETVARALNHASIIDLLSAGENLAKAVIPEGLADQLLRSTAAMLYLDLEEELIHFPWECVRIDNEQWIGSRFIVGRHVRMPDQRDPFLRPIDSKFVIISDPDGSLPSARTEGAALMSVLGSRRSVNLLSARVTKAEACESIKACEFMHFAGHSSVGGLHFSDSQLSASDIIELGLAPRMVFLNSCESGHTHDDGRDRSGLIQAFLANGTLALICTNSLLNSKTAATISDRFYSKFLDGACLGESFASAIRYPEGGIEWARYTIYGNPLYDGKSLKKKSLKWSIPVSALLVTIVTVASIYLFSAFPPRQEIELRAEEKLHHSACQNGSLSSCYKLGESLTHRGQTAAALPIFEENCESGDRSSCTSLAQQYLKQGSLERAKEKGAIGCSANESHCLGYLLALMEQNLTDEAKSLSVKLCEAGHGLACSVDATLLEAAGSLQESRDRHRKACELDYKLSCAQEALRAVRQDGDKSKLSVLQRYCEGRLVEGACTDYGSALISLGMIDEAIGAFDRDCSADTGFRSLSCELAGANILDHRPEKAKSYLEVACKAGRRSACAKLATETSQDKGNPCTGLQLTDCREYGYRLQKENNLLQASLIYEYVCNNGGYFACNDAGVLAMKRGNENDAERYYDHACKHDESLGCDNLALIFEKRGDKSRAIDITTKACERGLAGSCRRASNLIGQSLDSKLSLHYLARGCDLGHPESCNDLGYNSRTNPNKETAIESYKKACTAGLVRGCLNLGILYSDLGKDTEAITWFSQACNAGDKNGCDLKLLQEASGLAKEKRHGEASAILEQFCNDTRQDGCVDLGNLALDMNDKDRATKSFLKACHFGRNDACTIYGVQELAQGRNDLALEFCTKACAAGEKKGCECVKDIERLAKPR